jgi:hypothetical protein
VQVCIKLLFPGLIFALFLILKREGMVCYKGEVSDFFDFGVSARER